MRKAIMALEGLEEVISNPEVDEVSVDAAQGDELIDINQVDNQQKILSDEFNECNNDIDHQLETVATLESMVTALSSSTDGLTPNNYKPLLVAVEHLCSRVGIKPMMPAMEAFGGSMTKVQGTEQLKISLEGVISTVWEAIKKAFIYLFNLAKKFLMWLFGINKNTKEKAKKADEKFFSFKEKESTASDDWYKEAREKHEDLRRRAEENVKRRREEKAEWDKWNEEDSKKWTEKQRQREEQRKRDEERSKAKYKADWDDFFDRMNKKGYKGYGSSSSSNNSSSGSSSSFSKDYNKQTAADADSRSKNAFEYTDGYLMAKGSHFATFFGYQAKDPVEFIHNFEPVVNSLIHNSFKKMEEGAEDLDVLCMKWVDEIKKSNDVTRKSSVSNGVQTTINKITAVYSSVDKLPTELREEVKAAAQTKSSNKYNVIKALQMPFGRIVFYIITVAPDNDPDDVYYKPFVYQAPHAETISALPALDINDAKKLKNECDSLIVLNSNAKKINDLQKTLEKIVEVFQNSEKIVQRQSSEAIHIKNTLASAMTSLSDMFIYKEKIVNNALDYCISSINARLEEVEHFEKHMTKKYFMDLHDGDKDDSNFVPERNVASDDVEDVLAKGEKAHDYYSRKAA
jgi:hypothetical protein